jgi:ribosomal protein L27
MGRDFTIYATENGTVEFKEMTGHHRGQKRIEVEPVAKEPETK